MPAFRTFATIIYDKQVKFKLISPKPRVKISNASPAPSVSRPPPGAAGSPRSPGDRLDLRAELLSPAVFATADPGVHRIGLHGADAPDLLIQPAVLSGEMAAAAAPHESAQLQRLPAVIGKTVRPPVERGKARSARTHLRRAEAGQYGDAFHDPSPFFRQCFGMYTIFIRPAASMRTSLSTP